MCKQWKFSGAALVLVLALLSGCARDSAGDVSSSEAAGGSISEPAGSVTFEGTDLEGNSLSSDIFSQSKLTMVNVWATYCNPCLQEMPALGELAAEYEPEEFQIIGIISDVLEGGDQEEAERLVQQTGAAYPHLLLNESIYYGLLLDVTAVPTTFFLNQDGVILDTVVGAMKKLDWEDRINGLLETL